MSNNDGSSLSYLDAGVDLAAADALLERIRPELARTARPEVLAGLGGFAAAVQIPSGMREPVLLASCDGVGTKLKVAALAGRHRGIGVDLVAMNVNDVLCSGGEPLFFLDYFSCGRLDVDIAAEVIAGVADGCREAGCALVGGETAEMPGMYPSGEYDLAGFVVGVAERAALLDTGRARAGDVVIGLPSSGLHANGYSLARRVLLEQGGAPVDLAAPRDELGGRSLAEELLEPTRIYARPVRALRRAVRINALVHVTGGGLVDNPPRSVSAELAWRLDTSSWEVPAVMRWIASRGGVAADEMRRTFNMGLGMLAVTPAADADAALAALGEAGATAARIVGSIVERRGAAVEFSS